MLVVLRQTPLDRFGQSFNPARDFPALGGGIIAIAAIADAETSKGEARAGAVQVTGRGVIPDALRARTYGGLPEAERARVLSHCRTALRSAVAQALLKIDVVK